MTIRAGTHLQPVRRAPLGSARGFTLIETLLVMTIMAMLTAIVLPGFHTQRDQRADAEAKAYVRGAVGALEAYAAEHHTYDASTADVLRLAPELKEASEWSVTATKKTFEVQVRSHDGRTFGLRRKPSGRIERVCEPPGGGCQGSTW